MWNEKDSLVRQLGWTAVPFQIRFPFSVLLYAECWMTKCALHIQIEAMTFRVSRSTRMRDWKGEKKKISNRKRWKWNMHFISRHVSMMRFGYLNHFWHSNEKNNILFFLFIFALFRCDEGNEISTFNIFIWQTKLIRSTQVENY